MARAERIRLIRELEQQRSSRIICYLTGDRRGFETKIAPDILTYFYEHLLEIGKVDAIDLFLYSTGGLTMAGWRIVSLIREFCKKFSVLVPFKAQSCASLISLGADEIVMTKMGELSPIDPSVTTPFNPAVSPAPTPGPSGKIVPVNVEDVVGYFKLAKEQAGFTKPEELDKVFANLASNIHPLALGSVYKARLQIRMLAEKLLKMHLSGEQKIKKIIKAFTEELYSHDYLISRDEAKNKIGLSSVTEPNTELETKIWNLYRKYENDLEINSIFNADVFLGETNERTLIANRAYIESLPKSHVFQTRKILRRVTQAGPVAAPGVPQRVVGMIQERTLSEGWIEESARGQEGENNA
ncbi:MAG: serine protease [Candidatus Omnitrophota bacterium]|nr:MAG: serine protease [Candidatus Omnitrophota bacterium]